jgi:electron transport complex protein RnfB
MALLEYEKMEPLPIIHQDLCTGCHRCVDVCPTHALIQSEEKAHLHHPDRCTYCTACEDVCPEGAIELPFLIVFASDRDSDPKR